MRLPRGMHHGGVCPRSGVSDVDPEGLLVGGCDDGEGDAVRSG